MARGKKHTAEQVVTRLRQVEVGIAIDFPLAIPTSTCRRVQLIGFMETLNIHSLNAKDVKDHLPMDPAKESQAVRTMKWLE
jgi:hypothetical protein